MYTVSDIIDVNDIVGLESIDHQRALKLADGITEIIRDLRAIPVVSDININDGRLAKLISDCTGMTAKFFLVNNYQAYSFPTVIDTNHVFFTDLRRKVVKEHTVTKMLKSKPYLTGSVDLTTGKVTGDYTNLPVTIGLGKMLLADKDMSDESLAAFVLHEIGHALTIFAYLGEFLNTNYVLQDISKRAMGTHTPEEHLALLKDVEGVYGVTIEDKNKLAEAIQLPEMYRLVVLDTAVKKSKMEYNLDIYALRGWEQMSDNYVARQGYGTHLAIGLDTLFRKMRDPAYGNSFFKAFKLVMRFSFLLNTLTAEIPIIPPLYILFNYIIRGNPMSGEYDPIKDRINRLKHQLVDSLKDKSLSDKERNRQIGEVKVIENIMDKMSDIPDTYQFIYRNTIGIKQNNIIKANQRMEELANNDMFVVAAKVRGLENGTWSPSE